MGPIFNKKVAEKCNLWDHEQWFLSPKKAETGEGEKKKKKRKTQNTKGPFGLSLFLPKLKTESENTVAK